VYCLRRVPFLASIVPPQRPFDSGGRPGASQIYLRLVSDVRMVLAHRDVARYLLAERLDLLDVLLQSLACLQGMNAYQRKADEHVQWASHLWQHSVSLELHLLMLVRLPSMRRQPAGL
jgi:hypothetical protein